VRLAVVLLAVLALAACGSKKPNAYRQANLALLERIPAYPGSAAPKTTTSGASNTEFGARDWTLPAGVKERAVLTWYERALPARGWKIADESDRGLRAVRHGASVSIGVRGRTLEAIVNSRGG
jgi:hypothetical protein